jgi:hypothetical protein
VEKDWLTSGAEQDEVVEVLRGVVLHSRILLDSLYSTQRTDLLPRNSRKVEETIAIAIAVVALNGLVAERAHDYKVRLLAM